MKCRNCAIARTTNSALENASDLVVLGAIHWCSRSSCRAGEGPYHQGHFRGEDDGVPPYFWWGRRPSAADPADWGVPRYCLSASLPCFAFWLCQSITTSQPVCVSRPARRGRLLAKSKRETNAGRRGGWPGNSGSAETMQCLSNILCNKLLYNLYCFE